MKKWLVRSEVQYIQQLEVEGELSSAIAGGDK